MKRSRLRRSMKAGKKSRLKAEPKFDIVRPLSEEENRDVLEAWISWGDAEPVSHSVAFDGKWYDVDKVPAKYEGEESTAEEVVLKRDGKYYWGNYDWNRGYWEFYLAHKVGEKPKGDKFYFVEWTPDGSHWIVDPSQKYKTAKEAQDAVKRFKMEMEKSSRRNIMMGGGRIPSDARVKEVVE